MADNNSSYMVAAPVIGAAASAASNIFGNVLQRSAQTAQNDWAEKMWRLNNEYNKPINQRRRLEEAGLNANLMYGGSGSVSEAEQPSAPNAPTMNAPLQGYDVGQAIMNNINVQAQARLASAQAAKTDEEAANQRVKNLYEERQQLTTLAEKVANAKKGTAEYHKAMADYSFALATFKERVEGVKLDNRNKEAMRKQVVAEEQKLLAEQALLKLQVKWSDKLNNAQIGVLRAQAYSYMTDAQQAILNGKSLRDLNFATRQEIAGRLIKMGVDVKNANRIADEQVSQMAEQTRRLKWENDNPNWSRMIGGTSSAIGGAVGAAAGSKIGKMGNKPIKIKGFATNI